MIKSWQLGHICIPDEKVDGAVKEVFTIFPHKSHLGRKFTSVIIVTNKSEDDKSKTNMRVYAIKVNGYVTKNASGDVDKIVAYSPRRLKGEWMNENSRDPNYYEFDCKFAVYLH